MNQGRVRDNTPAQESHLFTERAARLPAEAAIEELIPWLYLKGISTGDFGEALQALVGERAKGLSPNVIVRLKEQWCSEYEHWSKRDLSDKQYVYVWADGIHAKVRLEDDANKKQCILVLMGATADGQKELIAVLDGYRESEQSWSELLLDLKQRGLATAPKIAVGDGALGFWAALRKVFPETREQRCWVHKTANVLNKMPKSVQPKAKGDLHEIWQAETQGRCREGVRRLPGEVRGEVPGGLRVPAEGSRRAADVLRLPGRALGPLANDQPDRIDVRDDSTSSSKDQRQRHQASELDDDVQAGSVGLEEMETTELPRKDHPRHRRTFLQRRNHAGRNRRLIQISEHNN